MDGRTPTPSIPNKGLPLDFSAFPPLAALLDGAHAVLTGFAGFLEPFAGTAAAALAIVLVTLVVRAALVPLGIRQIRAEIARRRLAPALAEIQRRYGKNPETVQRKTLELYQKEGVSPLAGILPALAQVPVVSLLYGVAVSPTLNGHPNDLLTADLGGAPLGHSLVAMIGAGEWLQALVPVLLLVVVGVTAWFTRRQTLAMAGPATGATATMTGVLSWMPFLSVVISAFIPLAAVLYVTTSTVWTFAERTILRRVLPGGAFHPATAQPGTA